MAVLSKEVYMFGMNCKVTLMQISPEDWKILDNLEVYSIEIHLLL